MQDSQSSLIGQRSGRLEKVKRLREMEIDPYPSKSKKQVVNSEVVNDYEKYKDQKVVLTGRLMSWREHGHIIFGHIQDDSGRIQLYLKDEVYPVKTSKNKIGWKDFDLIDVGDFLQVTGTVTKTNTGEVSLLVEAIVILTKAIRPLPEKWHGIADKEMRYRRRYLDMTMNPDVRERFKRRSQFWTAFREFMNKNGFWEVNIPVLEHVTGGADAKPFVTHYDALDQDFYLRISHELPLKRLLGAGFEKVYDIGARFRNEGFSDEHLPEHVAMEFYWAYADMEDGMKFTKEMFRFVMEKVYGKLKFNVKGFEVDLSKEWEVISYPEIISDRFGIDVYSEPIENLRKILRENGLDLGSGVNRNRAIDNLWKLIRKDIGGPAFITNVPKFLSPLAKSNTENPLYTDRFFLLIAGSELANAFSELNDPVDQLERFVEQQEIRGGGDEEAQMMDIDFVEMLEWGMPPALGLGISERVFWYFEDVTAREGVPFPQLKSEVDTNTQKIYSDIMKYIDEGVLDDNRIQDSTRKIVVVIDEKLRGWQLANTVGHISGYLGNHIEHDQFFTRKQFKLKDALINANSQYAIVVLTAKQSQLHKLLDQVREKRLKHLAYIQEMIDYTDDNKLQKSVESQNLADVDLLGVGMFGTKIELDALTKKFSLLK